MGTIKYIAEDEYCVVSGDGPGVALHHVKTRGSGGGDEPWNLMPLSFRMHNEVHQMGLTTFADRHPAARAWLTERGWILDPVLLRWVHTRGSK